MTDHPEDEQRDQEQEGLGRQELGAEVLAEPAVEPVAETEQPELAIQREELIDTDEEELEDIAPQGKPPIRGALRRRFSRGLIVSDPNVGELTRRGVLTRDPRNKERKQAGLKKSCKRTQFPRR